jgi:hypothetical protein
MTQWPNSKIIQKPEYDALIAGGITVTLNWEVSATAWHGGLQLGRDHGARARAMARALGHPDSRAIPVSIDSGDQIVNGNQPHPLALDYVQGFAERGGGPGAVYGGLIVIEACLREGTALWGWQAAASSWSLGRPPSPGVALLQKLDKPFAAFPPASYDWNETLAADWGQHPFTRRGAATLED